MTFTWPREPPRNRRRPGSCRAVAELRQDGVRGGDGRVLPSCVPTGRRGSTPPATLRYRPGWRDRPDHPGGRRPQFGQKQLDAGVVAEIGGLSYHTAWLSGGELVVKMQGPDSAADASDHGKIGPKRRTRLSRSGSRSASSSASTIQRFRPRRHAHGRAPTARPGCGSSTSRCPRGTWVDGP